MWHVTAGLAVDVVPWPVFGFKEGVAVASSPVNHQLEMQSDVNLSKAFKGSWCISPNLDQNWTDALRMPSDALWSDPPASLRLGGCTAIIGRLGNIIIAAKRWLFDHSECVSPVIICSRVSISFRLDLSATLVKASALVMKDRVTLDNTIGAAFLGVLSSCLWVPHDGFSKNLD